MARKSRKKAGKKFGKSRVRIQDLKDNARNFFFQHAGESFSYRAVIKAMGLRDAKSKEALKDILFSMEAKGAIIRNSDGRFISTKAPKVLTGRVDHVNPRFAYIISEDLEDDIWVKTDDLLYAIDGDEVEVKLTKASGKGFRPEGKVQKILSRNKDEFVGRIEISKKFAFIMPDSRNIHFDAFVHLNNTGDAKTNDKVIFKIEKWHDKSNKNPIARIETVLGPAGENDAEIHSIMAEFGLPFEFSEKVEKAAKKIPVAIDQQEFAYRKDFRDVTTFTIDPFDAKDFDDALSFRRVKDGLEVGIHIADVSHYVRPKTILEKEAHNRATSVYLVDRTIPMLPEKLSNGLCSLRPQEEKLTFSAVFVLDKDGIVREKWFGRTVIFSDRRFTYEEAQERIESKEGDFQEEINVLNDLSKIIRKRRFRDGAVNFETTEVKFKLDEKGRPIAVIPKVRKDAHKMIEEFMLLANREVATFIFDRKEGKKEEGSSTFVYRTHDSPDLEKLESFSKFASRFGHNLSTQGMISKELNKLMEKIEGKPEQNVLEQLAIRSMAKARYTTEPKGHFGLAFEHYTHFTSPIRRYPDVMVHRLLWHYLEGGKSPDAETYESKCVHASEREKLAAEAERASIKYKQVEYMQGMLGREFEGIVSGVTEWGIHVEIIETKCEGMVRLSDLNDDYYEFDEKLFEIRGQRSGKRITLGDKLNVQVAKTDIDRRTIDLSLVQDLPQNPWQADDFG